MANMSYCRFENTYQDLMDCLENIYEPASNERDERYRQRMIAVLKDVTEEYDLDEAAEVKDENEN